MLQLISNFRKRVPDFLFFVVEFKSVHVHIPYFLA
jgi:hypothetical protein